MAAFFEYARNITYYLLFAALVSMAVPAGKYQKYVKLVMGLAMVCMLLYPLQALLGGGFPVTKLFAGIVPVPAGEAVDTSNAFAESYEVWRYETLKTSFEEQLQAQLTSLLQQNGYETDAVDFDYSSDFSQITRVRVTVKVQESAPAQRPFIYIEPIRTAGGEGDSTNQETTAVKKLISDFYNLDTAHIDVKVRT